MAEPIKTNIPILDNLINQGDLPPVVVKVQEKNIAYICGAILFTAILIMAIKKWIIK